MAQAELERRVEDLEVKVSFQEHTIAELDDVIRVLRDQLDMLRKDHDETRAQLASLAPEPENTKPPHY